MARNVTVIPATINPIIRSAGTTIQKRKTAGYARVSTDKDEQFTSYEAQVDYYTQFIKKHADWEFVKVYTDEGISGLGTRKREGFNEMVADALAGKIDLIVTKSVSRFARNTVDSLVTIRKLKEKGVEVYFEKENIYSMDGKGELVMVNGENLLGLEVENDFFEVFGRSVDIFPIGVVLSVLQERQINRSEAFVYLSKTLVIASVTADIDLTTTRFDHERCPERLIALA